MEYDGKLDEETEAFSAELEIMLQGDLGINMVFILSKKFRAAEGQESTLEGDVPSEESFECRLAEVKEAPEWPIPTAKAGRTAMKLAAKQLCFSEPTKEMANNLRHLFITANFGGVPIPKIIFYLTDTTSITYNALLGRDWIHQSLCVSSTLHQQLALWHEEAFMEIVKANPQPFLPSALCFAARYYHDDLGPFTFFGVNQNGSPHGVTA
ncbi:unnamed protein product [Prunus armeniaca]